MLVLSIEQDKKSDLTFIPMHFRCIDAFNLKGLAQQY